MTTALTCPSCGSSILPPAEKYRVGRLLVDPARREIWIDGQHRPLRRRWFDFVAILAQRPGVVFDFGLIVSLMGVEDIESPQRYCRMQANFVRNEIGDAVEIRNHRLVGYSIRPTTAKVRRQVQRKMTCAEIDRAVEVYEETADVNAVARATGRHRDTVRSALTRRGYSFERTCLDGTPARQHAGRVCSLEEVAEVEQNDRAALDAIDQRREILRAQP